MAFLFFLFLFYVCFLFGFACMNENGKKESICVRVLSYTCELLRVCVCVCVQLYVYIGVCVYEFVYM